MPFIPDKPDSQQAASTAGFVPDKKQKKGGFLSNVWGQTKSSASKRFADVADTFKAVYKGEITPLEGSVRYVGSAAGLAGDISGAAITEGAQTLTGGKAGEVGLALMESSVGKAGLKALSMGADAYTEWRMNNPRIAKDLEAVVNIASILPPVKGAQVGRAATKAGLKAVGETTGEVVAKAGQKLAPVLTSAETGIKAIKEVAEQAGGKIETALGRAKEAGIQQAARAELPEAERAAFHAAVPENLITRATTATPETKPFMAKMAETAQKGMEDIRFKSRPIEIAGERLTEAASSISKSLKETGKQLGEVKTALHGKMVELPELRQSLLDDFEELGIKVGRAGKLIAEAPVTDDVMEVLSDIQKYVGWTKKTVGKVDARNVDRLRTYLFKTFTKTGVPLQSQAQGLVTKYRELLLNTLDQVDPAYGKLAREYAEKRGALEDFTKLLQYKGKMEDITNKSLRAGEVALRVLGNAADRPRAVIDRLIETARNAGYKGKEDIYDLIDFADELETITGPASRSLQGQVERAGESVLGKVPVIGGILEGAVKAGAAGPAEKIKALRGLFEKAGEKVNLKTKTKSLPKAEGAATPKTAGSLRTIQSFKKSVNQKDLIGNFQIGSFGKNSFKRKIKNKDRFLLDELEDTLKYAKKFSRASSNKKSYRNGNIVWLSKMPNGEKRVIYTRKNKFGKDEILNAHLLNETKNPKYLSTLESFGAPDGN